MRAPADGILGASLGITRTGMTVVIADNKSYPSEVAHPGLVLGDYARHEFGGVDAAVKKKPVQRGSRRRAKIHQPCGERQGQDLSVFEDDQLVAQGKVTIRDAHRPLGEHVHTLTGRTRPSAGQMVFRQPWKAGQGRPRGDLGRIQAEPKMREEVRKRMHHGATVVTTNESSTAAHRSGRDFVVIDGIY